jgi:hypothetical protein
MNTLEKIPTEWNDLILECHHRLLEIDPDYEVVSVEQRFGGLKYYFTTKKYDRQFDMLKIVMEYENASFSVPHRH